jgi:hypothetical protein
MVEVEFLNPLELGSGVVEDLEVSVVEADFLEEEEVGLEDLVVMHFGDELREVHA